MPTYKPALTVQQQIDFLKQRGVLFNLVDEPEAEQYLTDNTYFFKIKSYLANYKNQNAGAKNGATYAPSEFAYLKELSLIDLALSRLVLSMASNVEHAMKISLNHDLMSSTKPQLAEQCVRNIGKKLKKQSSLYTRDLYEACDRRAHFCIWELWELLGFNDQIRLYLEYQKLADLKSKKEREGENSILFSTRMMRNAAAHGNCLLANVGLSLVNPPSRNNANLAVTHAALKMCKITEKEKRKKAGRTQRLLDTVVVSNFAGVLVSHRLFVKSDDIIKHTIQRLDEFTDRVKRNEEQYFGYTGGINHKGNIAVYHCLEALIKLCEGYKNGPLLTTADLRKP